MNVQMTQQGQGQGQGQDQGLWHDNTIPRESYKGSKRFNNNEWRSKITVDTSDDARTKKMQQLEATKSKKYSIFNKAYIKASNILDDTLFHGIPPFFPLKKKLK